MTLLAPLKITRPPHSSMKRRASAGTLVTRPEHRERIDLLPNCPTLFQEFVEGPDYRVQVPFEPEDFASHVAERVVQILVDRGVIG